MMIDQKHTKNKIFRIKFISMLKEKRYVSARDNEDDCTGTDADGNDDEATIDLFIRSNNSCLDGRVSVSY